MSGQKCPQCGSANIELNETLGQLACIECGRVLEESTIVNQVQFAEQGDRTVRTGQFVGADSSKPYPSVRARNRYGNSRESRDATLAMARRNIAQVAGTLRLPNIYIDKAYRLYQLALQRNFIFGRRQMHVVATCLYTICRQEKSPHLLIDFSDALQVNVYVLGKSFLQFTRLLHLNLPIVDPALYIHRFSAKLELGDKMPLVCTTALRIVTRLKKDWIDSGRRPDGICAAAMLIAARSQGFHKTQTDVAKVFRVAPDTLRRRLEDFKATPAAQLTVDEFHRAGDDDTVEFDPPVHVARMVNMHGTNNLDVNLGKRRRGDGGMEDGGNESANIHENAVKAAIAAAATQKVSASQGKTRRNQEKTSFYDSIYDDVAAQMEASAPDAAKDLQLEAGVVRSQTSSFAPASLHGRARPSNLITATRAWEVDLSSKGLQMTETAAKELFARASTAEGEEEDTEPTRGNSSSSSSSSANAQPTDDGEDGQMDIAAVYKDIPDNGYTVSESEVNAYMLNNDETSKRLKIREAMFGDFMKDRDRRKAEKAAKEQELAARGVSTGAARKKAAARRSGQATAGETAAPRRSTKINQENRKKLLKKSSGSKGKGRGSDEDEDDFDDDDEEEEEEEIE